MSGLLLLAQGRIDTVISDIRVIFDALYVIFLQCLPDKLICPGVKCPGV